MKNFFNKLAEHWDDDVNKKDPIIKAIATLSGASEGCKILDIACGTGVMIPELLNLKPKKLVSIDMAENMIKKAQEKFQGIDNLQLICDDFMNFKENGFDVAIMYNAYPHFMDKEKLMKKVASLLVENGRFIVVHGAGRQVINECHDGVPHNISTELRPAREEAKAFEPWFQVDVVFDTPYFYMISGTTKK